MPEVVSRDGTRIAYDKTGSGPSVILIDGAFCSREFGPMKKLAAVLEKQFTVVSYDRRARGASGDTAPYAVQREIEDIDALMGAAGGRVTLYGVSSGAVLALLAAASLPVAKLALYEPPFMVGPHARTLPPERTAVLTRMIAEDRRSDAVKYYMGDIIGIPRFMPFVFQFLPMWRKLKAVAPSLPYDSAVMGDFAIPAEAGAIQVPTLVMAGTRTWPVLLDAARALAAAIPHARHETLAGQTHNVAAQAVAPVLEAFIKA
ncbi:MAG TPA: alpha/beta hydrolase [Steroidobacteraceae bacterium]|nr:alpha/beta hydrolase [Steroidobacteraceae bacterium]